jgi:deoxyribodipyrimidine photo-lyase
MPAVLWFRRDLRVADHPAILEAARAARVTGGGVAALFVLDDRLLASSGAPRVAYLLDSLRSLNGALGGNLTVLRGDPSVVVPELARDVAAETVHVSADFSPFGRRRDAGVEKALEADGRHLVRTGSPYAIGPGTLHTGSGTAYRVFTPFRRAWLAHGWRGPAPSADEAVEWLSPAPGLGVEALPPAPDLGPMRLPSAGEQHARRRWADFRDGALADYDWGRDRPDLPGTSWASPALKYGEVHPRTLLADLEPALLDERRTSAETYRSELAWREFHADVLFHQPWSATRSMRAVVAEDAWATGPVEAERLQAWASGRTGYPMVDAGMRQLLAEGWVHNRVRMIVASFLVKDLHVRWQQGAAHFMRYLVDGDVASNQQNWQWVAGTGTDAAPYFRIFNPVTQGLKFDPDGVYVRRYVPELAPVPGKTAHEPWKLPTGLPVGYPERIVDHAVERDQALADYGRRPGLEARAGT